MCMEVPTTKGGCDEAGTSVLGAADDGDVCMSDVKVEKASNFGDAAAAVGVVDDDKLAANKGNRSR